MDLHIITLCLDSMPYLRRHIDIFENSGISYFWHVVEGAANNVGSTRWCKPQKARLSTDGSSEYLNMMSGHCRLKLYRRQFWKGGKDEMCCAPLSSIRESCVLMQIDSDEIWKPEHLVKIVEQFKNNILLDQMSFICRYFVGPDIIINIENELKYTPFPWTRAWRFQPGMKFISHEPAVLMANPRRSLSLHETYKMGLVFDHYSYATESQLAYKQQFYGYDNAVTHWRRLQVNTQWPVQLSKFLPWAGKNSIAERIKL